MSAATSREIQDLFNRIAPVYDQLNGCLSLGQHQVWKLMAVKWTHVFSGATCLDLCCGSGDLVHLLARRVGATGTVYGVDFSPAQLVIAQQRPYTLPATVHWLEADVLNLPFDTHSFDAITMGYGLRNVVDIPQALLEMKRVLKPGRWAAILDLNRPTDSGLQKFQQWYLRTIVVPVAAAYGLPAEYAYLETSLAQFPTGPEQVELAEQVGFSRAQHYPIAGGTMGVLVVQNSID